MLGLVETIAGAEHGETRRDRPVEQIRLREPKHQTPLDIADLRGHGQRFAKPQEVVGLIRQPDEGARQSAHAAL